MRRSFEGNLMDLLAVYSDNFFREIYSIDNRALDGRLLEMKAVISAGSTFPPLR